MKRVHPASAWGAAAIIGSVMLGVVVSNTAAGAAIVGGSYDRAEKGHLATHRAPWDRHGRRPAAARRDGAGVDRAVKTPARPIRRLGVVYHPNGVIYENWLPKGAGRDFALSRTLAPLEPFRNH
jgi:hypothetical protein